MSSKEVLAYWDELKREALARLKAPQDKAEADFGRCEIDLRWSQNEDKDTYRKALKVQYNGDEPRGFFLIRGTQEHNPPVQRNFDLCRAADISRFWEIAWNVFEP